jgi:hypothetical protein
LAFISISFEYVWANEINGKYEHMKISEKAFNLCLIIIVYFCTNLNW